jgi:CBS domain-containing protein
MEGINLTGETESYGDEPEVPGEMLEAPLCDVPRRPVYIIQPSATVGEVIAEMNRLSIGCALIVEGEILIGIFTERDVLRRVAGTTLDVTTVNVREVMTPTPDTLPESASVAYALNRMSIEGYRHIPLLDTRGRPVGVVGMRDIINWMVDLFPARVLNVPPEPGSFPRVPHGG